MEPDVEKSALLSSNNEGPQAEKEKITPRFMFRKLLEMTNILHSVRLLNGRLPNRTDGKFTSFYSSCPSSPHPHPGIRISLWGAQCSVEDDHSPSLSLSRVEGSSTFSSDHAL